MKLRFLLVGAFSLSSLIFLPSCDGGSDGEDELTTSERDSLLAYSLEPADISEGDTIVWNTSTNVDAYEDLLTLGPAGSTAISSSTWEYKKTGDHLFSIRRTSTTPADQRLYLSLVNVLSDSTTTGAVLGSRLRQLIHRDSPIFTNEELQEIVAILNPSGAGISVQADSNRILSLDNNVWTNLITSNRGEQARGTMGGTYYMDADSTVVAFRNPNASEMAALARFLNADDWIPVLSSTFESDIRIEEGFWRFELTSGLQ